MSESPNRTSLPSGPPPTSSAPGGTSSTPAANSMAPSTNRVTSTRAPAGVSDLSAVSTLMSLRSESGQTEKKDEAKPNVMGPPAHPSTASRAHVGFPSPYLPGYQQNLLPTQHFGMYTNQGLNNAVTHNPVPVGSAMEKKTAASHNMSIAQLARRARERQERQMLEGQATEGPSKARPSYSRGQGVKQITKVEAAKALIKLSKKPVVFGAGDKDYFSPYASIAKK